jgi:hypothetical protein
LLLRKRIDDSSTDLAHICVYHSDIRTVTPKGNPA